MAVGKIQRTPQGLLQYLGMVGTGVPPTLMADEVRAVFDLAPFYIAGRLEGVGATNAAAAAVADFARATVPAGEMWLLISGQYGLTATTSGDQAALSFILNTVDINRIRCDSFPLRTAVAATARLSQGFRFEKPIVLRAGEAIDVTVDDINLAAGVRTISVNAVIVRFAV